MPIPDSIALQMDPLIEEVGDDEYRQVYCYCCHLAGVYFAKVYYPNAIDGRVDNSALASLEQHFSDLHHKLLNAVQ